MDDIVESGNCNPHKKNCSKTKPLGNIAAYWNFVTRWFHTATMLLWVDVKKTSEVARRRCVIIPSVNIYSANYLTEWIQTNNTTIFWMKQRFSRNMNCNEVIKLVVKMFSNIMWQDKEINDPRVKPFFGPNSEKNHQFWILETHIRFFRGKNQLFCWKSSPKSCFSDIFFGVNCLKNKPVRSWATLFMWKLRFHWLIRAI